MAKLRSWSTALLLTVVVACGGKSLDVDLDGDGGSGAAGSGQGGSGTAGKPPQGGSAGTASAGTASGGTASAGTGQGGYAGSVCDGFVDEGPQFVEVVIINKTSGPIHIGDRDLSCGVAPLFDVYDARGTLLPPPGECRSSCQLVMDQGPVGCPAICAYQSALTLQPGEQHLTTYQGRYDVERKLPKECVRPDLGGESCHQAIAIAPGDFEFVADAGTSLDCSLSSGPCGPCMPTSTGGCSTPGTLVSGKELRASTQVFLDGTYGVLGKRSSPAPVPYNPGIGGSSGGALALRQVQLVFTDR